MPNDDLDIDMVFPEEPQQPAQQETDPYFAAGQQAAYDPVVRQAALELLQQQRASLVQQPTTYQPQAQPTYQPVQQTQQEDDPRPSPEGMENNEYERQLVMWELRRQAREASRKEMEAVRREMLQMQAPQIVKDYMSRKEQEFPIFAQVKNQFLDGVSRIDPSIITHPNGILILDGFASQLILNAMQSKPRVPEGRPQVEQQVGKRQPSNLQERAKAYGFSNRQEFEAIKPGEWNEL